MTRQTSAPLERLRLSNTYRLARELVRLMDDGMMTADLPYQRGPVWTEDQRIALIQSWLTGTPIPAIIVNDRATAQWIKASGGNPGVDCPAYAVIDGKQRLLTATAWFSDALAVPASWFPPEDVDGRLTVNTGDGPYVNHAGLSLPLRRHLAMAVLLVPFSEAKAPTIEDEAAIYLRVNGGGTPQTGVDMERAANVAAARDEKGGRF